MLNSCSHEHTYVWETNGGVGYYGGRRGRGGGRSFSTCVHNHKAFQPGTSSTITIKERAQVSKDYCCRKAIEGDSSMIGACYTKSVYEWDDSPRHRWDHKCLKNVHAVNPDSGALGPIVNPYGPEYAHSSECCYSGGISAACGSKYTPRSTINDSTLAKALKEFFLKDWDYSGFLQEWEFMHYNLRYHSSIGRDWFGNERDWFGNWFVKSRNC